MQKTSKILLVFGVLLLVVALGGCDKAEKSSTSTAGTSEATVTFVSEGVTVDCAETGWTCANKYGGSVDYTDGMGGLSVTEMFASTVEASAKIQVPGLIARYSGVLKSEKMVGENKVVVIESASNDLTYQHVFKKIGDKVYRCDGNMKTSDFEAQAPVMLKMCESMRK